MRLVIEEPCLHDQLSAHALTDGYGMSPRNIIVGVLVVHAGR